MLINLERDMTWLGLSAPVTPAAAQNIVADSSTPAVDGVVYTTHGQVYGTPVVATPTNQGRCVGVLMTTLQEDNTPFRVRGMAFGDKGALWGVGFARAGLSGTILVSDHRYFHCGERVDDTVIVRLPVAGSGNEGKPVCFTCLGFNVSDSHQLLQSLFVQKLVGKPDQYAAGVS